MFQRKKQFIIAAAFIAAAGILSFIFSSCDKIKNVENKNDNTITSSTKKNLPLIKQQEMFFDETSFNQSIALAQKEEKKNNIKAIIVPHHLLASEIIAKLFQATNGREINKIIIIGPNHDNAGTQIVSTANACWEARDKKVCANQNLINKFEAETKIKSDHRSFIMEHSVGAMIPFIKNYFPGADVLPIIYTSNAGQREAEKISNWLAKNCDDNTLVVFSIDFSHYLSEAEAAIKDEITENIIKQKRISSIFTLNNDHLDSPATLATALLFAEKKKYKTDIIYHANSNDYSLKKQPSTTSYFGITISK